MSDTCAPQVSVENALDVTSKLHAGDGDGKANGNGTGTGNGNGAAKALAVADAEPAAEAVKPKVKVYPFWTSVRFLVITLLGFLGTINLYALRVNLSIALPCMVFINATKSDTDTNSNASDMNVNAPAGCVRELTNDSSDPTQLPFMWAGGTKGLVNGFFFVGYLFFQIPSALFAKWYGAKLVMLAFMSLATASSLLQHPFAVLLGRDLAHWSFIILRFFNGVGSAAFFPVYTALLAAWAPPEERSRMMGTAFAGMYFGIVLTFSAGGYICKLLGWAALFYIPGGISIVWLALWTALVANDPAQHRFISDAERDYILASQGRTKQRTARAADASSSASKPLSLAARVRAVWPLLRNVITSPCVLALCVANVAFDYGGYTFLTNIPSFMDEVLFFNIEKNGVLSAIPYLLYWGVITLVGYAVDVLLSHKLLSVLLVRKATTTIGLGAPAVVVCLLALTDCSKPVFALIILSLAVAFQGFCFSGCFVNYMEVAPRYAGAIFAIGNSLGSITGFVAPFLVGWITSNHTHAEWSIAFFVSAGVMAFGALVYLIFARADVQPWAKQEQEPEEFAEADVSYKAKGNEADAEASVRLTAIA